MSNSYFEEKYFANEYIEMFLEEEDLVFARYRKGVYLDLEAARKVLEDRNKFLKGRRFRIYAEGPGLKYWTKEAREFQASPENNEGMKAAAFITNSYAIIILIRFYLFFNKPNVPQNIFSNKEDALKWLDQFK